MRLKIRNKGFTLTEILLVMVIGAVLIVGAFWAYAKVSSSNKVKQELDNIKIVVAGIHSLYGSSVDYRNLNNSTLMKAKVFPDNMLFEEATNYYLVKNTYKSPFNVSVNGMSSGGSEIIWGSININTQGIPSTDCTLLANSIYNSFGSNGELVELAVDGITVFLESEDEYSAKPYDLSKTSELCGKENNDPDFPGHRILLSLK